jgi:coenzyme F420-reducing hydrogenase gamma subunit
MLHAERVDIVHFAEMGARDEGASVSTPHEVERIRMVRERAKYAIGAFVTSGGIQALRNLHRAEVWKRAVYASSEHISE